jgi:multidrug efflux pump subunit AcrB
MKLSSYTILILFVILILTGSVLVFRLSFQLEPSVSLPSVTVSYSWPNMPGRVVEQEVTSVLESGFSRMKGIEELTSTSSGGRGTIRIAFDKTVSFDAARFEVSSIIRQLYPKLPDQVSYPQISINRPKNSETKPLLSYTLNASASPFLIQKYAEDNIKPLLASVNGIYKVEVSGATPMEWHLEYRADRMDALGVTPEILAESVKQYIHRTFLGNSQELSMRGDTMMIYLNLRNELLNERSLGEIPVTTSDGRIMYLAQLVTIKYVEREPEMFYRINGLNTINLRITANTDANHLEVSKKIKEKISALKQQLPPGYKLLMSYDSTEFILNEIRKISTRAFLTLLILMVLIIVVSRQWKFLLLIMLTLIASLSITSILCFAFRLEMRLYSLTGVTVSLGMILDNAILMIDHIRHKHNKKVFLALLAATLSTVSALLAVFFLPDEVKISLTDFAFIVIINLSVSLLVTLFFIPAMMDKLGMIKPDKQQIVFSRRKRGVAIFGRVYSKVILALRKRKAIPAIIIILLFGMPVFMLPPKLEGTKWYHNFYNKTFSSELYTQKIKPVTDKALGGTLRLFSQNVFENSYYRNFDETVLRVYAKMPYGSTVGQLNDLMRELERYLQQFNEIRQFQTTVWNGPRGSVSIYFKNEHQYSGFPHELKNKIIGKAVELSGPDWSVYGVGQGFSNAAYENNGFYRIILYGYNYDELFHWGERVRDKLMENPRIQAVNFLAEDSWEKNHSFYYAFRMNQQNLARKEMAPVDLYNSSRNLSAVKQTFAQAFIHNSYENIRLYSGESQTFDMWNLSQHPLKAHRNTIRIAETASIIPVNSSLDISRINQQYQLVLAYDYVGSGKLGQKNREKVIKEISPQMPMGYSIKSTEGSWFWKDSKKQYWLLMLIIVSIFFICAILLESLRQPFAVIIMIPVSYIGLFLTFYLFQINFDQGGFAAFILLSGISVNSALYILNDFNNLKRQFSQRKIPQIKLYLKAYQQKIVPILLTTVSTSLGLVPFIIGGQNEAFWFSLAAGTIGGIVFSLLGIIFILPVLIQLSHKPTHKF